MALQIVFQFEHQKWGWSEVHYANISGPAVTPAAFIDSRGFPIPPLTDIIEKRRAIMAYQPSVGLVAAAGGDPEATRTARETLRQFLNPRLIRVRVSTIDPNIFRTIRLYEPVGNQQYGTFQPYYPVESWTRLHCIGLLQGDYEGHMYLGAVPEIVLDEPQDYVPTQAFTRRLNEFFAALTQANWCSRLRPRRATVAPGGGPPVLVAQDFPITGFVPDPSGLFTEVTAPALIPNPGFERGLLVIRGRHPSEWNGVHRYEYRPGAAPTFMVGPARQALGDWVNVNGPAGRVQLWNALYAQYLNWQPDRFVDRDTGGPFGRPVGRRKRAR